MRTTASVLLHIGAAVVLALLFNGRCGVNAQSPLVLHACFNVCESTWGALLKEASPPRTFLARFQNSSRLTADYYCNIASNVSACFDQCKTTYSQFLPPYSLALTSAQRTVLLCKTDNGKCRALDSQLWCNAYSPNMCGAAILSNEQCIRGVQSQRGCNLSNPIYQSQKAVLTMILDARLYCFNNIDLPWEESEADSVQTCLQYVPRVCLANLTDSAGDTYASYYSDMFQCSEIQSAKDCLSTSLTQTVQYNSKSYSMPCKIMTNGSATVTDISNVLNNFVYSPCPPPTTAPTTISIRTTTSAASSISLSTITLLTFMAFLPVNSAMSSQ